ncbi:Nif3-like dinuclear metal center hexameric protein [Tellurirhabdus rosea]|uniref:Nif3-like dinuclear metal center hexameric protein n=1 Tax=Tellurirhabdus rosea TaxID=2674997 RepID=UPI0022566B67|nr:Nif3-like dinuclear metal center hexameric protein [Tellurirhabdus rosea]
MTTWQPSRRDFLLASLGLTATGFIRLEHAPALTVGGVIDRIKTNVGIPWREQTVDNLIVGAREQEVKGIAVAMMATLDVARRAAAQGLNLIITHEPTFFNHPDKTETLQQDPVYQYKRDFLEKRGLSVFHFHDHWHGRKPDGIATGMAREMGWEKYMNPEQPKQFTLPETTLSRLARELESKLKIRTMRVVGDPNLPVRNVLASWGNVSLQPGIPYLAQSDVLIVGETHEWELVEYVQDAIAAGQKKALIVLGHLVSEQAGMKYCAEWLKGFVPEVPVAFVAAPEPFWRAGQPVK